MVTPGQVVGGKFSGLPEGQTIPNLFGSGFDAIIRYSSGTDGNDVVLNVVAETTVAIVGNDLVITDSNGGNTADDLTIKLNQADPTKLEISDANVTIAANTIGGQTGSGTQTVLIPLSAFASGKIIINTLDNADNVTIDTTNGLIPNEIDYNGGDPTMAPGDELSTIVTNGQFSFVTYNYTNSSDGNILMIPAGAGSPMTINYTGLEPIDSVGNSTNLTFNLTPNDDDAVLEDFGANNDGRMQLRSTNGSFETTLFDAPSTSLTLNGNTGNDNISVSGLDTTFAANLTIDGQGGTDSITISGASDTNGGDVSLLAETTTISGALASDAGNIALTTDSLDISAAVTGSGSLTIAPQDASATIGIGDGSTGTLNLTDAEVGNLANGFSSITIGDATNGAGAVDIDNGSFLDPLTIVGGSIAVTSLSGTDAVNLTARTGAISDNADATTDVSGSSVSLTSASTIGAGDPISIAGPLTTVSAGDQEFEAVGAVDLASINSGGNTVSLQSGPFNLTTDAVNDADTLTIGSAGTLDVNSANDTLDTVNVNTGGTLQGVGTITAKIAGQTGSTISTGAGTLNLGVADNAGFSTAGSINVGAGETLVITDNNTADLGSSTVVEGTLTAANGVIVGAGDVLSGNGDVNANVQVENLGEIEPGLSTGILEVNDVTFNTGSTFDIEIAGTTPGAQHDQLNVVGTVDLGNATLTIDTTGLTVNDGDFYLIVNNDGTDAITGTFNGLAEGATISTNFAGSGKTARITYQGGRNANDAVIIIDGPAVIPPANNGAATVYEVRLSTDRLNIEVLEDNVVVDSRPLSSYNQNGDMLVITGEDGQSDTLIINYTNADIGNGIVPIPVGGATYSGGSGAGNDVLRVLGNANTVVYTPDTNTTGDGDLVFDLGTGFQRAASFTGLEPVDITGFASATLNLPGADDVLTIENGVDFTFGGVNDATRVSGTSGGVPIETAAFWNNTNLIIDTSIPGPSATGTDGNDAITLTSLDNNHLNTNVSIITGAGNDTLTWTAATANIDVAGDFTLQMPTTITQPAGSSVVVGGTASFDSGANDLTLDQAGNDFNILTVPSSLNATVNDTNAIDLGDFNASSLNLTTSGNVTDSGAIIVGAVTISAGATNIVELHTVTNDIDTLTVTSSSDVSVIDIDDIDAAGMTVGRLTLVAGGAITDSAPLIIAGPTNLANSANPITLDEPGNDFQGVVFATNIGANDITLVDSNGLQLGELNSGGTVNIQTGGALTDSNGAANDITATSLVITGNQAVTSIETTVSNLDLDSAATQISNTGALVVNDSTVTGQLDLTNDSGIAFNDLNALNQTVNVQAGGAITDANAGANNITASTLNITGNQNTDLDTTVLNIDLTTATTDINNTGSLTVFDSTLTGDLTINNSAGVSLDDITATGQNVFITTTSGDITDNNAGANNLTAAGAVLNGAAGVGVSGNSLEMDVDNLEGDGGSGGFFVIDSDFLTVGGVSGQVGITAAGGDIDLNAARALTVNEAVTQTGGGNITMTTTGNMLSDDIVIAANVTASGGNGNVVLNAAEDILHNAGVVSAAGSGIVDYNAGTVTASGVITMAAGTQITSDTGDITLDTAADITIAEIDTNSGNVSVTSADGSITVSAGEGGIVSTGGSTIDLTADTGVTVNDNLSSNGAQITIDADADDSGAGTFTNSATIASGNGIVQITAADVENTGTVDSGTADLFLTPSTAGSTIGIGGAGGAFNLSDADMQNLNSSSQVVVGRLDSTGAASITAIDLSAETFDLTVNAASIDVNQLDVGPNDVTLNAVVGAITDGGGNEDIFSSGTVNLAAVSGIGGPAATASLDISGASIVNAMNSTSTGIFLNLVGSGPVTVNASAQTAGDIVLTELLDQTLTLGNIDTDDGNIDSTSNSTTLVQGTVTAGGTGDIDITTTGGDITVTAGTLTADGDDIQLTSGGNVNGTGLMTSATLSIDAQTGAGTAGGNELNLNVDTVAAQTAAGDIAISDQGTLIVGTVNGVVGLNSSAGNGNITVLATGLLTIDDNVQAGAGTVAINTAGATENAGDAITAANLVLAGAGAFDLAQGNDVDVFAAFTTGAIDFNDTDEIEVGTVAGPLGAAGVNSGGNNVDITSAGNQTLSQEITAVGATATLHSTGGALLDNNGGTNNVTAAGLVAESATGVGTAGDAIETTVSNLEAVGGSGGVNVINNGGLTIGDISATVGVSATGGNIIVTANSPLIINEDVVNSGGGNIDLTAAGAAVSDDMTINANITASGGNGNITLNAGDSIMHISGTVSGAGAGVVDYNASTGTGVGQIGMSAGTAIASDTGDITLDADGNIAAAEVDTNAGNITVQSADGMVTVLGGEGGFVSTGASTITINADTGVSVNDVITTVAGTISINADVDNDGTGTLNSTAAGDITSGNAAINVTAADMTILGDINSGTAAINLIPTNGGTVDLGAAGASQFTLDDAELDLLITSDRVNLGDGTTGNIELTAPTTLGNATVLDIVTDGTVNDNGAATTLTETSLEITAAGGIGTTSTLNVDVMNFAASVAAGGIDLTNFGALSITTVCNLSGLTSTGGSINVTANGLSIDQAVSTTGGDAITLDGGTADLSVNASVSSDTGSITLQADNDVNVAATQTISTNSGVVTITGDADSNSDGTINVAGDINHGTGGTVLSSADADGVVSGVISGTGGLTKNGPGTIDLQNANTYSGVTTINAGVLDVSGSLPNSSAVNIENGGTLNGDGSITNGVNGNSGGFFEPGGTPNMGATSVGSIATGPLDLNAGHTLNIDIEPDNPAGSTTPIFDVINVTGAVDVTGSTLVLDINDDQGGANPTGWDPQPGTNLVLVQNDGADPVVGEFVGFAEGSSFMIAGEVSVLTYAGGDGNDIGLIVGGLDFGDAPTAAQSGFANSYPVTIADDGARAVFVGPRLGANIDFEANGVPSANADSDDTTATADEDGISFPASIIASSNNSTQSSIVANLGAAGTNNFFSGWIDFNRDGDWDDAGEQILSDVALTVGDNLLTFTVPQGAAAGNSFARFRVSETASLGVRGLSTSGEVEDYAVTILAAGAGTTATINVPTGTGDIEMTDLPNGDLSIRRDSDDTVLYSGNPADAEFIVVNGTSVAEVFTLRAAGQNPFPAFANGSVTFNGNDPTMNPGDTVVIVGDNGTSIASGVYTPDATTTGNGRHDLTYTDASTGRLIFTGLEPTEVSAIPSYTLTTPGSVDVLTVSAGSARGGQDALVVTGTSDGVAIESLTLFDVASFTIDSATNDAAGGGSGSDSVAINSGLDDGVDLAQGLTNLSIDAGAGGTGDADSVTVSVVVDLPGSVSIDHADTVDVDFDIQAGPSLAITNVDTEIDLAMNADLTADNGDIDVATGVTLIDLSAAGGMNRITANDTDASGDGNIQLGPVSDSGTPGAFIVDADNAVTTSSIDVQSTISIAANQDATGAEGFTQGGDITTTNDTAMAVAITVNSFMGGTGNADITSITTGTTAGAMGGRVTISSMGGSINDSGAMATATNITSGNAILTGAGVGSSANPIETAISNVEGSGGAGGFFLRDDSTLTIGGIDGGTTGIASTTGDIDILIPGGAFTVTENVTSTGGGNVTLKTDDTAAVGDDLTVNAGVNVNATSGNVSLQAGDNVTLTATSVVNAGGTITITGDCNDADAGTGVNFTIAAQLTAGSGGTINGGSDDDTYNIFYPDGAVNNGTFIITDTGGTNDVVNINGTPNADTITMTTGAPTGANDEQVSRGANEIFQLPGDLEAAFLLGGDGNDIFNVQPSMLFPITVNGQNPVFGDPNVPPGDQLNLDTFENPFTIVGKTIFVANGSPNPFEGITFVSIESLPLTPVSSGPDQRYDLNDTFTTNGDPLGQSPTQTGFTGVTSDTVFDPNAQTSHGWDVPINAFDQGTNAGAASALINDGHFFTPPSGAVSRTFSATVGNGWVLVTVAFGHDSNPVDGMRITNADDNLVLASGLNAAGGTTDHTSFLVLVQDGSLNLRFDDPEADAQGRRNVAIQSIEIETGAGGPLGFLSMGFATPSGTLDADGTTVDTFTLAAAPPNSLVTVETTLGTIVGTDADANIDGFQVLTDGSGEAPIMIQRPSVAGSALVNFSAPTGAKTGCVQVNYGQVNTLRFDLNTPTSTTFEPFDATTNPDGWIGVSPNDTFSATQGYGWLTAPNDFLLSPSTGSSLLDDGHRGSSPNTFRTILDNGTYDVTVTLGGVGDQLGTSVTANGTTVIDNLQVPRAAALQKTFSVTVTGGQLDLQFSQTNNVPFGPHWEVSAISIVPTTTLGGTVTAGANIGNVAADGTTSTAVSFNTTAPDGALFTVSSSLGTITTADADSMVSGTQVASAGGTITIALTSPTMSGVPTFTLTSLDGQFSGTITDAAFLNFTGQTVRRFDFNNGPKNGTTSATAAGFTSVSRDHQSPSVDGFGYGENNLRGFVTFTGDIPGATNDDLFRDGHQNGHSTSTFLVQADAGTDYDLRVYLGHQFLTRDNIEVTVEGADTATQTAATTSEFGTRFTSLTFTNADDADNDGFITLSIVDRGGVNFGYSINGLDVATAGNLPAAETLLAGSSQASYDSSSFATGLPAESITTTDLTPVIEAATTAFTNNFDLTAEQAVTLATANFVIADLSGGVLAEYLGGTVYIDDDATGAGWHTGLEDPTPANAAGFDLLTAVAHELGHALGFEHSNGNGDLMNETLNAGDRHDSLGDIDDFFGDLNDVTPFED